MMFRADDPVYRLEVLAMPVDHVEGVAETSDGALWAGGEAGQLYRIAQSAGRWECEQVAHTAAGMLLGIAVDSSDRIYICSPERRSILRYDPASGATETYADGIRTPNVAIFEEDGSLLVSDSGSENVDVVDGKLIRIPPGGGDMTVLDLPPLHFPNGLAALPDGTVAVAESFAPRISTVDLRRGRVELLVALDRVIPDGLACDEEGGMLISCFQPNTILRFHPESGLETVVEDWTGQKLLSPTNVAYIGPDRRTIAIASLLGWALLSLDVPWRGAELVKPDVV